MSQRFISAINPDHSVMVGWDNPLRTFLALVNDQTVPEDEDDLILSLGDRHDEIKTVEELQTKLSEYAVIPDEMIAQLNQDKADGIATHSPTPLQQRMEQMMKAINPQSDLNQIEVVKCKINWWLGWSISPSLQIWVSQSPDWSQIPHKKFLFRKDAWKKETDAGI